MSQTTKSVATVPTAMSLTTEEVACAVCGHQNPRRLYTETYRLHDSSVALGINQCRSCTQVYVSPRLDQRSTARVYIDDRQHTISYNYCWAGQTRDERFTPLLDRLSAIVPGGSLLDVGCGSGQFLAAAASRKRWQLMGIDPHPATHAIQTACCPIIETTLEEAHLPPEGLDVVTLLGVLEHVHDPVNTLNLVGRLLKPAGVLAIYVPNFRYLRLKDAGFAAWIRSGRSSCLAPQEHLFHFTVETLSALLRRCRFEITRLDVGRPFFNGNTWHRWLKGAAFGATKTLYSATGIHLGGLEVIARRRADDSTKPDSWSDCARGAA